MKHLNETTNVRILSQFDMDTGYQAVVQKGNVGSKYVYGLQLRKGATTILRGYRGSKINNPILELSG
ncbi:bacteriocin, partial [Lactobacillus helveticus]